MLAESGPPETAAPQQQQLRGASNMLQEQQTEAGTQSQIKQSTAQPARPGLKTKASDLSREFLSSIKSKRSGQRGATANGTASASKGPSRFAKLPFVANPNVTSNSDTSRPAAGGYAAGTGDYSVPEIEQSNTALPSRVAPDAGPGILNSSPGDILASPLPGSSAALSNGPAITSQTIEGTTAEGTTLVTTTTTTRIDGEALDVVPLATDNIVRPKRYATAAARSRGLLYPIYCSGLP